MKAPRAKNRWSAVRKRLETLDRAGLLTLIADLYKATGENRRFLERTQASALLKPFDLAQVRSAVQKVLEG